MSKFLCTSCGACCKFDMVERGAIKSGLPLKADGSCANLIGNLCSVYDNRPDVCNSDKWVKEQLKTRRYKNKTKKDIWKDATRACHDLIDRHGLDPDYKVDLKEYDKK